MKQLQTLLSEIVTIIVDHCTTDALKNLRLTCKWLNAHAAPVLFSYVFLSPIDHERWRNIAHDAQYVSKRTEPRSNRSSDPSTESWIAHISNSTPETLRHTVDASIGNFQPR